VKKYAHSVFRVMLAMSFQHNASVHGACHMQQHNLHTPTHQAQDCVWTTIPAKTTIAPMNSMFRNPWTGEHTTNQIKV
jgi:hypothetical protein